MGEDPPVARRDRLERTEVGRGRLGQSARRANAEAPESGTGRQINKPHDPRSGGPSGVSDHLLDRPCSTGAAGRPTRRGGTPTTTDRKSTRMNY